MNNREMSKEVSRVAREVKAAEIGGWFPLAAIMLSIVEWIGYSVRRKTDRATGDVADNVVVKFKIKGVVCKTYLSTLLGLWENLKAQGVVEGDFLEWKQDEEGNEIAVLPEAIKLGYAEQKGNKEFPLALQMSVR